MLVVLFLFYVPEFFQPTFSLLIPICMLMLFVLSAAVMGILVFGQPILWYLDGKKQEAISLLMYTLGIFFCIWVVVLGVIGIYSTQVKPSGDSENSIGFE